MSQLAGSRGRMNYSVIVFVMSVIVTLLFQMLLPSTFSANESSDYDSFYEPVARSVMTGSGPTYLDGSLALRYPPGYPIILAIIFSFSKWLNIPDGITLSVFTFFCVALASLFLFMLARIAWGDFLAFLATLGWMTYPFAMWLTKQPNSEIPFMPVLYASFFLLYSALLYGSGSRNVYFLCGMLIGIAMLIRPVAIGLGLIAGVIIWLAKPEKSMRYRLSLMIVLLLGNLVVVLPWEGWIYATTGKIELLSTGGTPSMRDGLTFAVNLKGREGIQIPQDVRMLMDNLQARLSESKSLDSVVKVILEELQTQPHAVIKLFAIKAARSWFGTDSQRLENLIILIQVPYLCLALSGTWAIWRSGGTIKSMAVGIWLIVMYFWAMSILGLSILRYMVPAMGLLFILMPGVLSNWFGEKLGSMPIESCKHIGA